MDSFFARNRLSAYLDGALDDAESAELSNAIERDPALRGDYEAMRRAVDLLRQEGPTEAPRGFHARVMESVRDEPLPTRPALRLRRWFARVPVEALALAAAAAVVVIMIQGRPETGAPPDKAENHAAAAIPASGSSPGRSTRPPTPPEAPVVGAQVGDGPIPLASSADGVTFNTVSGSESTSGSTSGSTGAQGTGQAGTKGRSAPLGPEQAPYSPDWEQQGEVSDPPGSSSAGASAGSFVVYNLRTDDPNTLFTLQSAAKGRGGQILDQQGAALRPFQLNADRDYVKLLLIVPAAEAPALRQTLTLLGAHATGSSKAPSGTSADQAGFQVEVGLQ